MLNMFTEANKELISAVEKGDIKAIKTAIREGAELRFDGDYPLRVATWSTR